MSHEQIKNKAIFQNDYTVLKKCKHDFFLFNKNDNFIGRSLDVYGEWCEGELATMFQILEPGHLVIDVGANIGTHTIPLAKKVTEAGLVLAFEPQRQVFGYLAANVSLNNLLHVVTYQQALGSSPGQVRIPLRDPRLEFNFGGVNVEAAQDGESVDVLELDNLNIERCKLIKIDVEGMERKVIEGAQGTIRRSRPVLFVETTTVNHREVVEILRDFRYESWWHIASYYNRENFSNNSENIFSDIHPETNLLCFPKESAVSIDGLEKVQGMDDTWQAAMERVQARQP